MIAWIVLAALLGVGGIVYAYGLTGQTPAILEAVMAPFTLAVERAFTILAYLAPILVAVVPLYLVLNSKGLGEKREDYVIYAAVFGLGLYGLAIFTGVDHLLVQDVGSWTGSTLGIQALGGLADWVAGILTGLVYWGSGLVLVFVDAALDVLVGIGQAARAGKRATGRARKRLLEGLRE